MRHWISVKAFGEYDHRLDLPSHKVDELFVLFQIMGEGHKIITYIYIRSPKKLFLQDLSIFASYEWNSKVG